MTRRQWNRFARRRINLLALAVLLLLILGALLAPFIAAHDPLKQDYQNILAPPSRSYLLGTDSLGRDLFSRILYGGRISLSIGVLSMGIATFFGLAMGIPAGYFGGWFDSIVMWFTDILLSIPGILLALTIVAILGPSMNHVIIAIGISSIPTFTRVVRGSTLSVKEQDYVTAAKALGQREIIILLRYILPNISGPIIVLATLRVAIAVINAAALSFIGLGAQPPTPEWGALLSEARSYMREAWWFTVFPGAAIMLTVFTINTLGDGLVDVLDPKTNR